VRAVICSHGLLALSRPVVHFTDPLGQQKLKMAGKRTAKLPSLDHLTMEDYECVYEPSDDTFLLCDALENDREEMTESRPQIVMEVGCGSGCVITFLSMLLKEQGISALSIATDINPKAAAVTLRTAAANKVSNFTSLTSLH
jgi:tRNA1(Val) A37 N6-methylase TrmN6